jgi:hypothetical protein
MIRTLFAFLPRLWTNWLTLTGSILTTFAAIAIMIVVFGQLTAAANPYATALLLMGLPTVFVFGLLLIPLGLYRHRKKYGDIPPDSVQQAFIAAARSPAARGRIFFVGVFSIINIAILVIAGGESTKFMDSPKFCGTTCHTVMEPEWTAYTRSSHSRVDCVRCHIGPGASWAVKAKIDGLRQVMGVITGDYSRPVPTPVHTLRPSRDTCEQCHWPSRFHGTRVALFPHFAQDETNTPGYNAMVVRLGGANPGTGKHEGIHWHVSEDFKVSYQYLDEKRLQIGRIQVVQAGKVVREYNLPGLKGTVLGERTMDCIDCHNRPTHVFDESAQAAVDRGMHEGKLDRQLPYLAKVAATLLGKVDLPRAQAKDHFRKAIVGAYAKLQAEGLPADPTRLTAAADQISELYLRNVFPEMKVIWGTYRSHLGHGGADGKMIGCFRCHDDTHEAKLPDGKVQKLSQDCDLCHEAVAEDADPAEFEDTLKALLPMPVPATAKKAAPAAEEESE